MNLLEHYVTNITKVKKIEGEFGCYYKVVADVDCYGDIKKQKHFTLFEHQWKQVQEKGYYLA